MIVYNLGCANDHRFEGWFSSPDDFEQQTKSNLLNCPLCGNNRIERMPHAPYVSTGTVERQAEAPRPGTGLPHQYANVGADLLANLIDQVLEKTEDVGRAFPEEARKIHYREAPERHIRGNATVKEVKALLDEGIEVVALPIPPHRLSKTH
ncbi:MAG TPA: DUF1178 family protein [Burkholderiales bacterium]|nr:DUF1178 family protein [Burkholderiales bacterium]